MLNIHNMKTIRNKGGLLEQIQEENRSIYNAFTLEALEKYATHWLSGEKNGESGSPSVPGIGSAIRSSRFLR